MPATIDFPVFDADHVRALPDETPRAVMGANLDHLMGISVPA